MKITRHSLPTSRFKYEVELSATEVDEEFEHALSHLAPTVKISGFRSGKAPIELVKQNLDSTTLREEAYSLVVGAAWRQIINGLKELPIQDPEVSLDVFEEGQAAKVIFEFDVRPEVKIGAWRQIKIKNQELGINNEPSDQEVTDLIESLQRAHAKTVVKLEPAKIGDKVHLDFEGSIKGVKQEKLSAKNFPLVVGHSNTIPGFDSELIGLKKGGTKKFKLKFPKDHFDKSLANQEVEFKTDIQEVFDVILPELNDEFAKSFGHTKTEQLKNAIKEDLKNRKKDEQFVTQKAKWLAEFEHLVKCDLPNTLIKAEVERSRASWRKFLQERTINENTWLTDRGITFEQLEADWTKAAHSSVKIGLGLAEIAKDLKKDLQSNEDFQKLLDELVQKSISN